MVSAAIIPQLERLATGIIFADNHTVMIVSLTKRAYCTWRWWAGLGTQQCTPISSTQAREEHRHLVRFYFCRRYHWSGKVSGCLYVRVRKCDLCNLNGFLLDTINVSNVRLCMLVVLSFELCPCVSFLVMVACWLERQTRDRKVASSNPGRSGGRIFSSRVNFVFWLIRCPFHPRVNVVA